MRAQHRGIVAPAKADIGEVGAELPLPPPPVAACRCLRHPAAALPSYLPPAHAAVLRGVVLTTFAFLVALIYLLAGGGLAALHSAASATQLWLYSLAGGTVIRPPALHGPVQKLGVVNTTFFYPPVAQPCKAERLWWYDVAAGRANQTQASLAALSRGPCMPCQVYVVSWRAGGLTCLGAVGGGVAVGRDAPGLCVPGVHGEQVWLLWLAAVLMGVRDVWFLCRWHGQGL